MSIYFVSGNIHKIQDARSILSRLSFEVSDRDLSEIQSLSSEEVIRAKLQEAYSYLQAPCFVMDASLEIEVLGGFPGALIKWFYSSIGDEKIAKMVAALGGSSAIFRSVLGYFDGKEVVYFQEIVSGSIAPLPIGNNGYHWDTIFIPDGSLKSFAQMGFEEKQSYAPTRKLLERFEQFVVDQGEK